MRPQQRIIVSLAGALGFAAAAAIWCALTERVFEAAAPVAIIASDAAAAQSIDIDAARLLLATEPVLRRAALSPAAAAAIERHARPTPFDRLSALVASRPANADTLSRATAFLGDRVDLRASVTPGVVDVVARMPTAADAAAVATAVAEAFVADLNETMPGARGRTGATHATRLDRASRRLEEARERTQTLRAADPEPVASIAQTSGAGEQSGAALARLQREAQDADARLAEAAKIFGPRHPRFIERETEARNARAALEQAARRARTSAASTPARSAPAEGGPDPRTVELAAADDDLARAQEAYDRELSRNGADMPEARMLRPAPVPARSNGAPAGLAIAGAGLAGFLLFGLGQGVARERAPRPANQTDRRLATLRGGAIGRSERRNVLADLNIADGRAARKILVVADDAALARAGAEALAFAAQAEGWRPLLVAADARARAADETTSQAASLDGRTIVIHKTKCGRGVLHVARFCARGPEDRRAIDASLAFDIVFAATTTSAARRGRARWRTFDGLARVAHELSDEEASRLGAQSGLQQRFLGTVVARRLA